MELLGEDLLENLTCYICNKIYTDPVILLPCSHSFCQACLNETHNVKENKCRRCGNACKHKFAVNHDLKAVCEKIKVKRRRMDSVQSLLCLKHDKGFTMFCNKDKELVCPECLEKDHIDHTFCTIAKVADDYKSQLQDPLQQLGKKLEGMESKKVHYQSMIPKLQDQAKKLTKQINDEFVKLNTFLKEEQKKKLDALKKVEQEKISVLNTKIAEVKELISDLSKKKEEITTAMNGEPSQFIKSFKETEKKAKLPVPDPQLPAGHMIDEVKHVGNLRFKVWKKMQDICPCYPVILDPSTKMQNVEVSPDLVSMTHTSSNLPINKRRWDVLGSEGYNSGTHAWEVEVENCEYWFLGVVKESAKEEESQPSCPLSLSSLKIPNIKKVCVVLDIDKGLVTYSDHDGCSLKTQAHTFTEKMYPGFITVSDKKDCPLKIVPAKVSVSI